MKRRDLVVDALRSPSALPSLPPADWDLLIRQARHADLLGRLAMIVDARALQSHIPAGPRGQLEAARVLTLAQQRDIGRELEHVAQALLPLQLVPVLLKGAAYLASGGPASLGRSCADIDILVPKHRLPEVEAHLMMGGWVTTHSNAYDQRYYRNWMHELPPMEHAQRQTVLDVHHAIAPPTSRVRPDANSLLTQSIPVSAAWRVLAPIDMVLHCVTHLLQNEEFSHGLRDLSDLDLMLRRLGHQRTFWSELVARAQVLGLSSLLNHGLRLARTTLGTPVPEHTLTEASTAAQAGPLDAGLQTLWRHALASSHTSHDGTLPRLARSALYLRAHWVRMPPALLGRHLCIKGWRRFAARWRSEPT